MKDLIDLNLLRIEYFYLDKGTAVAKSSPRLLQEKGLGDEVF
jgi:hypothetical protein